MKANKNPRIRRDLEFFPIRQGNSQFVLVRDHLGLVEEGKAVPWPLYEFMTLLDGTNTVRDIQMALIRQKGGVLVGRILWPSLLQKPPGHVPIPDAHILINPRA